MVEENKDNSPSLSDIYTAEQKKVDELKKLAYSLMPPEVVAVVQKAKAAGIQPYTVQIGDDFYLYRGMSRLEYRSHLIEQAQIAEKLMQEAPTQTVGRLSVNVRNEDTLVIKCILFPNITQTNIGDVPAGTVETLHNAIMSSSGFGQEPIPIKL